MSLGFSLSLYLSLSLTVSLSLFVSVSLFLCFCLSLCQAMCLWTPLSQMHTIDVYMKHTVRDGMNLVNDDYELS